SRMPARVHACHVPIPPRLTPVRKLSIASRASEGPMTITVDDYRPSPALDEELAALGYTGIQGWPDQAPVDASLARAMLRPAGMTATTLLLHRDDDGRLLAGAAVRWPATLDSTGRLWGPVVQPEARGHGLGRSLMLAIDELLARRPGVLISTTEIPE